MSDSKEPDASTAVVPTFMTNAVARSCYRRCVEGFTLCGGERVRDYGPGPGRRGSPTFEGVYVK